MTENQLHYFSSSMILVSITVICKIVIN